MKTDMAEAQLHNVMKMILLTKDLKCMGMTVNYLYLHHPGDVMPCKKNTLVVNEKPYNEKQINKFSEFILKVNIFDFVQVAIEAPDKLFQNKCLIILSQMIILDEIKTYKKTGRKTVKGK